MHEIWIDYDKCVCFCFVHSACGISCVTYYYFCLLCVYFLLVGSFLGYFCRRYLEMNAMCICLGDIWIDWLHVFDGENDFYHMWCVYFHLHVIVKHKICHNTEGHDCETNEISCFSCLSLVCLWSYCCSHHHCCLCNRCCCYYYCPP